MSDNCHQIGIAQIAESDGNFAGRLRGVRVKQNALAAAVLGHLFDGLQSARLVVGQHECHEHAVCRVRSYVTIEMTMTCMCIQRKISQYRYDVVRQHSKRERIIRPSQKK